MRAKQAKNEDYQLKAFLWASGGNRPGKNSYNENV